jgi:hypothetical protein
MANTTSPGEICDLEANYLFLNPNRSSLIQIRLSHRPRVNSFCIGATVSATRVPITIYCTQAPGSTLDFHVRHLQWAPHRLSGSHKSKRLEPSKELVAILESAKRRIWVGIMTLHESWFYPRTEHELIWLQPGEEVPGKG